MKKVFLFILIIASSAVFSQKVKLKGDYVYVDGNKCMKYTSKTMGAFNTFYTLDDKKLFYADAVLDETSDADFKIQFIGSDEIIFAAARSINFRTALIEDLISEDILNKTNCEVDFTKIAAFKARYNIEQKDNTTVIINQTQTPTPPRRNGIQVGVGFGR